MQRGEKELCCLEKVKKQIRFEDCMGMTNKDWEEIQKYLKTAVPNEQRNNFPDFIFDNGFIEHFQVTSSKTTKKVRNILRILNIIKMKLTLNSNKLKKNGKTIL